MQLNENSPQDCSAVNALALSLAILALAAGLAHAAFGVAAIGAVAALLAHGWRELTIIGSENG